MTCRSYLLATDADRVQEAQAEVQADSMRESPLTSENTQPSKVIDVETVADGGKIVYIR